MKIVCFSSFTFSYLDRARVLFRSVRRHHPDWRLVALITDQPPPEIAFQPEDEVFDDLVFSTALGIADHDPWLFQHDVVEACTAVKGRFLELACERGDCDVVVYLDPDIALFDRLDPVLDALKDNDIVLTPHLIDPELLDEGVRDNEMSAMRTGIYNLGFLAVRTGGEGRRFAHWWAERLGAYCFDDPALGLFTDQKWCDHIPAFFARVAILRDPGCNVASWNLSRRRVGILRDGTIQVNERPLRFWHFTKLGQVGESMTRRYAGENFHVYEIWNWYKREIADAMVSGLPDGWWAYGAYQDGALIAAAERRLYRDFADLRARFPNPFRSGSGSYQEWVAERLAVGAEDAREAGA